MIKRIELSISTQVWDHSCVTLDKCLHLSEPVYYILLHFKITTWDFPGDRVVKTPCF